MNEKCIVDRCKNTEFNTRGYTLHWPAGKYNNQTSSLNKDYICNGCISELALPLIGSGPVERMMVQRAVTRKLEQ